MDSGNYRSVILVEGESDKAAVEAVAELMGRDLECEGTGVIPMGGVTNVRREILKWGPDGAGVHLAGLCDEREEHVFRFALEASGLGSNLVRAKLESLGFFVCVTDLEWELIDALGPGRVVGIIEEQGDRDRWRLFTGQPAQRQRSIRSQLHRFMGTKSGRKTQYARALVSHLELAFVPHPLIGVLRAV
jgi:Overcoming lysogenization defect protein-like, TOPRIM domain